MPRYVCQDKQERARDMALQPCQRQRFICKHPVMPSLRCTWPSGVWYRPVDDEMRREKRSNDGLMGIPKAKPECDERPEGRTPGQSFNHVRTLPWQEEVRSTYSWTWTRLQIAFRRSRRQEDKCDEMQDEYMP